jgi:uncharacterized membrane protein YqhA|tara:strand:+ start:362 stop:544 length:183 start_codon:yes stop_codon:yes gene_type:complete
MSDNKNIIIKNIKEKLEAFMSLELHSDRDIRWQIIIHLVFVVSGLLLASLLLKPIVNTNV